MPDIEGSEFYFSELEAGMSKHGDSETYYLYKISAQGIPAITIYNRGNDFGFIKRFASRHPNLPQDEMMKDYGLPPIGVISRFTNYIEVVASKNHEVQLAGPIPPDRIEFVEARLLSENAIALRNELLQRPR